MKTKRKKPKDQEASLLKSLRYIAKARVFQLSLFYWALANSFPSYCQSSGPDQKIISAYSSVLDFNFQQAKSTLHNLPLDPQENPYAVYVLDLAEALEVFTSDDEAFYQQKAKTEEERLDLLASLPNDMPEKLFLQAETKIHWAFLKYRFGHYLSAFFSFRQAYFLTLENIHKFPDYLPSQKSLGVLHILFGAFPDNYNWVLSLSGLEGDIEKGAEELSMVGNSGLFFSIEANIYRAVFQIFLLNQKEEALASLEQLEKLQKHATIELVTAYALIKNSQSLEGRRILLKMQQEGVTQKLPFIHYLLGETYLHENLFLKSAACYRNFLDNYQGKNYVKDAYTKIAICYWLLGDDQWQSYMNNARESGSTNIDIDKNAAQLIKNDSLPNKTLLKIRYATDGGFFEIAEKYANSHHTNDFKNGTDRLEFHYRKARLYHKTDKIDSALAEYRSVIKLQGSQELYFAPNSCLQVGYILSSLNKPNEAISYFELATTYKNHPYKFSIDKKARIEIEKLKEKRGE